MSANVQALLDQLRERVGGEDVLEGWEAFEARAGEKFDAKQLQDQLDHATMYRQAFTSQAGIYVLEELIRMYLRQRIAKPGDDTLAIGLRQGGAEVVQRILFLIEFANKGGRVLPEG